MSVYVDQLADHGWRLGKSCHMIADTLEELHAMAERIGMKRAWFQPKSFPHYDLVASRRKRAIAAGAIDCNRTTFVAKLRELRDGAKRSEPQTHSVATDPPSLADLDALALVVREIQKAQAPSVNNVHLDRYLPFDRENPDTGQMETINAFVIGRDMFVSQEVWDAMHTEPVRQQLIDAGVPL